MKKIFIAATLIGTVGSVYAQTPEDALRYSWLQSSGTARSQGIANANGAIGGEVSTIFSNPANIGFYKTGDFVISGGSNFIKNNASYLGVATSDNKSSGFLGTTGFVLGKPRFGNGKVKSSAFGIAVNRLADFNNRITYTNKGGQLSRTSMANMFMEDISNNGKSNPYGSGLAYETYWVDKKSDNTLYSSAANLAAASGLQQKQSIVTNGGITELAFAGAANINDKTFIGGTIGIPILRYGATRRYDEQDPGTTVNQFNNAYFDDDLLTRGVGINFKAGAVLKASDNLRIGVYAHSPTFYSLTDNYTAAAGTDVENYPTKTGDNIYEARTNDPLVYEYNLQTPYKLGASFSLLFGNVHDVASQKGFLSGDVEYVNYAASKYRITANNYSTDRNYFNGVNSAIGSAYRGAVNARVGAELKFNPIMVRFGGAYYGNPYNNIAGESGSITQATGGLGYRNRGFFIDLGYVHSMGEDVVYPYRLAKTSFQGAEIKSTNYRILLTLGFKI